MILLDYIEAEGFSQKRDTYFQDDEGFSKFQVDLARNPQKGDVMRSCGGLRKVRWEDPRRGKGKRGGLRIIYLYVPEAGTICLLKVYDKDEADDLTAQQKRILAEMARNIKQSMR